MADTTSSVRELRDTLADAIDRATHDEVTIVTRRGRQVAAVVPIEMVAEYRRWEEERVAALIDERMAMSDGAGTSLAEVMAETLARPE